jgi:hypothetical protein
MLDYLDLDAVLFGVDEEIDGECDVRRVRGSFAKMR